MNVGRQIGEVLELHQKMNPKTAADRSCELLQMVGIENATRRISSYPHEFSGGQRQRVMIAIALACRPRLLIADEPTTALDVTVQKQILELLGSLCEELGTGLLLISHDLAVLSGLCGNLIIMYAGMTMESGRTRSVLSRARHPYTRALLETLAGLHGDEGRLPVIPGEPPDFLHPPNGCPFHPRCKHAFEPCDKVDPSYRFSSDSDEATAGYAACHLEQRL
jgi:oligopeptide transport system ATP-binding protein